MCYHSELEYKDTIEATTSITIDDHDDLGKTLSCNNEYGHRIREDVICLDCGKSWKVGPRNPKFITDFVKEINKMRDSI